MWKPCRRGKDEFRIRRAAVLGLGVGKEVDVWVEGGAGGDREGTLRISWRVRPFWISMRAFVLEARP